MADFYFDIETYQKTDNPNFGVDPIIAITYQQIDSRNGEVKGDLIILKAWESSEQDILRKFYNIFKPSIKFDFVPIGCNLSFDFTTLLLRWRKLKLEVKAIDMFCEHPYLDIQTLLVLFNRGRFKEASLERFTQKQDSGDKIKGWYEQRDYGAIENYIKIEASSFIELYQFLIGEMPHIWVAFAKEKGIIV